VVYFADDDNAYDVQLFAELPATRQLSMVGVGFRGASRYQGCHTTTVNPSQEDTGGGKIDSIVTNLALGRKYPIDMAGFAFSTAVLLEKQVRFQKCWTKGHLESKMVESIVGDNMSEIEPLAGGCTRILAWHVETGGVRLEKPRTVAPAEFELLQRLI
jgi:galactosylgalactosylxylosylprotein 3-beta-glucuronosyltransferase 3